MDAQIKTVSGRRFVITAWEYRPIVKWFATAPVFRHVFLWLDNGGLRFHRRFKWAAEIQNLTTNVGLDELLQRIYKSSSFTAADYIGLTDGTPTFAAGDTMSSHAGWTEISSQYSEGTRQAFTAGTVASQSVDNSASKGVFNFTGSTTVGGAFICDNATKGGTSGILLGGGAFSVGDKAVANTDVLNVTVTCTQASA